MSVHKVIGAAVTALSAAAIVAIFAVLAMAYQLNRRVERATREIHQDEAISQQTVRAVQAQMLLAMQYVYAPDSLTYRQFRASGERAYRNVRLYLQRSLSSDERRQVERIKELHEQFEVNAGDAFTLAATGRSAEARRQVERVTADARALRAEIDRFLVARQQREVALEAYRARVLRWLMLAGAALALTLVAIAAFIQRVLRGQLLAPLAHLTAEVGRFAESEKNIELPVAGGKEIRALSRSFNDLVARLSKARSIADESLDAAQQSEERFRALIENASDTVTVLDATGVIIYSGQTVSVLGKKREDLIGRNILEALHPDDVERGRGILAAATATGQTVTLEMRARHADGSYRWLEIRGQSLLDHPAVRGVVINSRDITDRKEAEAALEASETKLRQSQKMEAIGQLAGGVAHDFNNILTAIKGYAQLAAENENGSSNAEELDEIRKAADRAAALTAQLLAFSRKQLQQTELLDMNGVVADMERLCTRLLGEHITTDVHLGADTVTVYADKSQIEQVVLNLAVNARDAMPNGGVLTMSVDRVVVEAGNRPQPEMADGSYVRLRVADTGRGMTPDVMARIFDPFFTTKEVGRGTGLGLSTVYGVVKQSGGFVDVQSEPDNGTSFSVWLPCADRPVVTAESPVAESGFDGTESVLVVEDEPAVRNLARRMLERKGYRVTTAVDGVDALAALRQVCPDVVVADMVMPRMGGAELAAQIAVEFPALPIVLVSGYSEEEVFNRVREENPQIKYVPKPYAAEELLSAIRTVLRSARSATLSS